MYILHDEKENFHRKSKLSSCNSSETGLVCRSMAEKREKLVVTAARVPVWFLNLIRTVAKEEGTFPGAILRRFAIAGAAEYLKGEEKSRREKT